MQTKMPRVTSISLFLLFLQSAVCTMLLFTGGCINPALEKPLSTLPSGTAERTNPDSIMSFLRLHSSEITITSYSIISDSTASDAGECSRWHTPTVGELPTSFPGCNLSTDSYGMMCTTNTPVASKALSCTGTVYMISI